MVKKIDDLINLDVAKSHILTKKYNGCGTKKTHTANTGCD